MKESVEQLHSRKSLRSKEKPASLEKDGKSTEIIERMQDLLSTVEKAKNVPSGKYNREQKRFLIYSESTKKGAHKGSPESLEEIEVIFQMPEFFSNQLDAAEKKFSSAKAKGDFIKKLTEYQYLISHFIEKNKEGKEYLDELWKLFERIANIEGVSASQCEALKSGILGQVATGHLFQFFKDVHTEQATPHEDAFYKIDLWIDDYNSQSGRSAVQTTTSQAAEKFDILTDFEEISFPALKIKDSYFSNNLLNKINRFRMSAQRYAEEYGEPISSYLIILPRNEIDSLTGVPSEKLSGQFTKRMSEILDI
ncbi:MAG: hypothetical protein A3H69_02145 [Candidatus Sungbacteria bacterium RIFCSPLOWO2_02_FULL_47_9]|uniref:Uncharacterized protein n=1 Tax=Candidatus Sungbacteria bacterium RIFCSPHIGHO2_01_FULL_47_32 TaxID=1802264 RepID=A0A1G2K739_9BACT|nr:MAG: hypothetical protein UX72_C0001G0024 [Parcubacteria group bacterium GW2011_GWA2_47_10]OGZ94248.1 MAG: hypothetical protein A2633_05550 [Candidatus Sungbacteria bacterium RIFCSPHIGHO2_01_FULL_47_32]OGZ99717.1 MAG: hypothetical protein A3D57_02340 [Candidatus Sungbacteria bacterium RIFCSPHIGHO2_02_FULL_46_12]OHA05889.1 MAG: hypothetical protein A3A28_02680 [Candidatus Sungbacteria bacterium RIFCSPLOWO2_01_FULL_47_32]OHA08612.1 MAG: hypothetical protein A3H69_02145 [Candidatus Sungbacteria